MSMAHSNTTLPDLVKFDFLREAAGPDGVQNTEGANTISVGCVFCQVERNLPKQTKYITYINS